MILSSIMAAFLVGLILIVWFKSDAFVDWLSLFGLGKLIKANQYKEKRMLQSDVNFTYPKFLKSTYRNFFFKLIGCPLCLSMWLSFVSALVISFSTIMSFEVAMTWATFIVLLLGTAVVNAPIICIVSLFIYGKTAKLLNEDK